MSSVAVQPSAQAKAGPERTLRVAVITASVSRLAGGLFYSVPGLSRGFVGSGCEIRAFGGRDVWTAEDVETWAPVPVSVQQVIGPRTFGFQRGLMSSLHAYCPDIVHVHGLWMYPSLAAVRWSVGAKPYVISPRGMLDAWALNNSGWKKWVASRLYEDAHLGGAACLHALCDAERDAIRAYGLTNPVCVIPNGVDLPTVPSSVRPEWEDAIPSGAKVLLYLGRIHPKKGLFILLHAWHLAIRNNAISDDWFLVIVGWDQGGHQEQLRTLARDLGIDDRLHFAGPQFGDAKQASYERAQAFVLPSFSEGLPMVVLEAWAHGLPVLMTPQCNLPIGFERGAALAMETEVDDAARCLGELSAMSEDSRRSMGVRGRELVAAHFTWSAVSDQMRQVYAWVLGKSEQPAFVSK